MNGLTKRSAKSATNRAMNAVPIWLTVAALASGLTFASGFGYGPTVVPVLVAVVVPLATITALHQFRPDWGGEVDLPALTVSGSRSA